jgi:hypothetical protein
MKVLLTTLQQLILVVLLFYPFWLLWLEWMARNEPVVPRNNAETAKILLIEYQLVVTIDAMRKQLGQKPYPQKPLIEDMKDRDWEILKLNSRQIAEEGVRRMSWIES